MDTPWLHVYTSHTLSQLRHHTFQLTSELIASKWLTVRNVLLEGFYADRGREKEARLKLYTPTVTYIQVRGGEISPRNIGLERTPCLNAMIFPRQQVGALWGSKVRRPLHLWSHCGLHCGKATSL